VNRRSEAKDRVAAAVLLADPEFNPADTSVVAGTAGSAITRKAYNRTSIADHLAMMTGTASRWWVFRINAENTPP